MHVLAIADEQAVRHGNQVTGTLILHDARCVEHHVAFPHAHVPNQRLHVLVRYVVRLGVLAKCLMALSSATAWRNYGTGVTSLIDSKLTRARTDSLFGCHAAIAENSMGKRCLVALSSAIVQQYHGACVAYLLGN